MDVEASTPLRNIPEAMRQLRVSRRTIYRLLSSGAIKAVRIGRCRRIPQSELDAYVARLMGVDA